MKWRLLRFSMSREQKKEPPSCPSTNNLSAIVCAMVLFPVPANPFSQYTGGLLKSLDQCSIPSRIVLRVPLRQPLWSLCRYSTPFAQRNWFRAAASAVGGSCQTSLVRNGRCSDLNSGKKLSHLLRRKRGTLTIELHPCS